MKSLNIKSAQYLYLLKGFQEWLEVLGYASGTVGSLPVHVREFLHFLESRRVMHLQQLKAKDVFDFGRYLKSRPALKNNGRGNVNSMAGGALSASSINKTLQAVNTFATYLQLNGFSKLSVQPRRVKLDNEPPVVLDIEEIKALYEASYTTTRNAGLSVGQRDRALLGVFYGCGLRAKEAIGLNVADVDFKKRLLWVRHGKGNKERLVPIAHRNLNDLESYIEEGRHWFMEDHSQSAFNDRAGRVNPVKFHIEEEALFLSNRGKRLQYNGIYIRLQLLSERAGIERGISPHNLRHSIATHLLQGGMDITEISRFLGHSSLESTQIYTHIINGLRGDV